MTDHYRWTIGYRWTVSRRQFFASSNLGACPKCMAISTALFILSLLVLGAGVIANSTIVSAIGLLASAAFGLLVGLHAIFFVRRRRKVSAFAHPQPRRSCCGSA
jgi:hypothetical protein